MNDRSPTKPFASRQFEDVLAEFLQAEEQGLHPDPLSYLATYPELADRLREAFRDRTWFEGVAHALAPLSPPADAADDSPALPVGSRYAGHVIEGELGRGGMGIVYKARQLAPDRLVALKVIRTDRLGELPDGERRRWISRFHREAQLVAALDLPAHIVTLHEVGEQDSQPYFTMRLIEGGSLAQRLRATEAEGPEKVAAQRVRQQRANARLLAQVAVGVDYAHRRGILHGDLKPANILLDADGRPLVTDFGLARRLDGTGSQVADGFEGTAAYAAPEQARGAPEDVTTAADVYGLGAILYELLTGRPPFHGVSNVETLMHVLSDEPVPPRRLDRRLNRDLQTICLKCLNKEPERRYPSAAAVANDLENWMAGRPINARPASTLERTWRWCQREPILAGAIGFAAVALVAFALVAGIFAFYRERANRNLGKAAKDLADALETAKEQRNQTITANHQLRAEQRTTRQMTAGLALDRGRVAWQAGDPSQGLLWMTRSLTLAPEDDAALQEAIRIDLAAWLATLPPRPPPLRHPGIVAQVSFSPDGNKVVALSTGRVRLEDKVFPDGRKGRFLVARPKSVGDPFFQDRVFHRLPTAGMLQPSLRHPVTARGQIFLWDTASSKPVNVKLPPNRQVLAATPDGRIALTAERDRIVTSETVQLWSLSTGKPIGEAVKLNLSIPWAACSGDGKTFVAITDSSLGGSLLILWDTATGRHTDFSSFPIGKAYHAALSSDGKVLALVTDSRPGVHRGAAHPFAGVPGIPKQGPPGEIKLYDLVARQRLTVLPEVVLQPEVDSEAAVAVGPGGRLLLTASPSDSLRSGAVRLWDRNAKKHLQLLYQGRLAFAQFSPDGKVLLTASGRGPKDLRETVQLWDTATGQPRGAPLLPRGPVQTAGFSPESKLLAIGGGEGDVQLWETATGRPLGRAFRHPGPVYSVAFSPDGTKLVTGGYDGRARIWDTHPSRLIQPVRLLERVAVVALTADGSRNLQRGEGNTLQLHDRTFLTFVESTTPPRQQPIAYRWDAATGRFLGFERNSHVGMGRTISPDGHLAMSALGPYAFLHVDGSTGKGTAKPIKHHGPITGALFSPDSRILLTTAIRSGSWEEARLWDVASGKPLGPPMPHQGPIRAKVFSPDAKMVLTGSDDGTARLWDAATGKQLGPLLSHGGRIRAVAFRPDGKLAATAGDDGTARLWHVATGQPLGPPLPHPGGVSFVAFGTGGETLVTVATDNCVRVWKVPQAIPGAAKRLLLKAEIETGVELDGSTPRLLDDAERARRTHQLEKVK